MSKLNVEELIDRLEDEGCDLRCINMSTGGGDYDFAWIIISHYMTKPKEREIGRGDTVIDALRDAFEGA